MEGAGTAVRAARAACPRALGPSVLTCRRGGHPNLPAPQCHSTLTSITRWFADRHARGQPGLCHQFTPFSLPSHEDMARGGTVGVPEGQTQDTARCWTPGCGGGIGVGTGKVCHGNVSHRPWALARTQGPVRDRHGVGVSVTQRAH